MKTTKLIELVKGKKGEKKYNVLHDFGKILNLENDLISVKEVIEYLVQLDRNAQTEAKNKLTKKLFTEGAKAQKNGDYETAKEISNKLNMIHELVEYKKIINEQDIYCVAFDEENPHSIDVLCEIEIWDNLNSELLEMYKELYKSEKEFIEVFKDRIIHGYHIDSIGEFTADKVTDYILTQYEKNVLASIK